MPTTLIKNAAWVVAWDDTSGHHAYRRDIDVAFKDDRITYIGPSFAGHADRVIDGGQRMVMPGLLNIHSHPEHEPLYRGIREEHGLPSMHMTGLYERSQSLSAPDDEARAASAESAYCELLLCGVTSLVDISPAWPGWLDLFARSGMRGFLAPGFASARWYLEDDHELRYAWDEERGWAGYEAATKAIDDALAHSVPFIFWSSGTMAHWEADVYAKKLSPAQWNARWWEYVKKFQGVESPSPRGEEFCDAATKTHINDTPCYYYSYAIATVLKFQLNDHIARQILHQPPQSCNYANRKDVGDFLKKIMVKGGTEDWRKVLREATGEDLSTRAMVEYFKPLMAWLEEQNKGREIGW